MRPPTFTGIRVPNRLKSRSSRHPANEHGLAALINNVLEAIVTYTRDTEVGTKIEHVCRLVTNPIASFVLPSASAPVRPTAVLAGVTLEY